MSSVNTFLSSYENSLLLNIRCRIMTKNYLAAGIYLDFCGLKTVL